MEVETLVLCLFYTSTRYDYPTQDTFSFCSMMKKLYGLDVCVFKTLKRQLDIY